MAHDGNTGQNVSGGKGYSSDVGELQKLYRQSEQARERFIADWYLNSAFYVGQQWLYWNRGRLDKPRLAQWRETVVDNRIQPVVLSRVARKVKTKPTFVCTPRTADEQDIEATEIGNQQLEADWKHLELQRKLFRALLWADITGAGFWKIYWDATKGESNNFIFDGENPVYHQGTPLASEGVGDVPAEMIGENWTSKPVAQGDICVEIDSPFELYPDPLAQSFDEAEWIIEKKVRSLNYVKEKYNFDAMADTNAPLGPVESRIFASMVYAGNEADYRGVSVYEYWCKPNHEHPKGKRCVWANDQVLYEEEAPFDTFPYVMFSGITVPGRFWPTSLVTQLRGPQTELNKVRSQIAENGARIGNPSLLTSRHANVKYTGLPGERVYYDSTVQDAVPSYLQPPDMPVYVREEIERIVDSISEISGLHEVSKAQVPTGVTAASAINLLMEADDTRIGPEIQDMERGLEQAGQKILRLRAQFNTDERMIRIAGEDGFWDIAPFRGSMLRENTDVEVQAGSGMPRSKAAKQAAMTELLNTLAQYGIQLDPRDLRRFAKEYEVGGLDKLFEGLNATEQQIQRENRQLATGTEVPIKDWDDDQAHIEGHDEFRMSSRYEKMPPPLQQLFDGHVTAHRQRAVAMVEQQMAQQAQEQQQQLFQEQAHEQEMEKMKQNGKKQDASSKQSAKS